MLETTLVALQDILLDKVLDENGRKALCSEFPKIMQQVHAAVLPHNLVHNFHNLSKLFLSIRLPLGGKTPITNPCMIRIDP